MLPSAYGLGQYFQDLGHSFSPYGPPSRQITYIYNTTQVAYCTVIHLYIYIQYQNEISKHLKVIYMLQALDLCHQDKLLLTLINPLTPKISFVILLTDYHTVLVMLVWRI